MKKSFFLMIAVVFINCSFLYSQSNNSYNIKDYHYYLCKTWGFLKYYHSEIAAGNVDWDNELLNVFDKITDNISQQEFLSVLSEMIDNAGTMKTGNGNKPYLEHRLKVNYDTSWIDDSIFNSEIQTKLLLIENNFRPQKNVYLDANSNVINFLTDNKFNDLFYEELPPKNYRFLILCRYWNIINYFFPYKNLMDQNWDLTLKEFLPQILNADDYYNFHLKFNNMTVKTNDGHVGYSCGAYFYYNHYGKFIAPVVLRNVENQVIVTDTLLQNSQLQKGDILLSINSKDINTVLDSLKKEISSSCDWSFNYLVSTFILRSKGEPIKVSVNRDGKILDFEITDFIEKKDFNGRVSYYSVDYHLLPKYTIIEKSGKKLFYLNNGLCTDSDMEEITNLIQNNDALIIDCRNYPNGLGKLHNILFDKPYNVMKHFYPNPDYPGTFTENIISAEQGNGYIWNKPVYILMNEVTVSAAEYLIMGYELHPKAIKIGSNTAGTDGAVTRFSLPGKVSTKFTSFAIEYTDGRQTQRVGLVPDIEVLPTIDGIKENKDEVLNYAIEHFISNVTSIEKNNEMPDLFTVEEAYPNPFNAETNFKYYIPEKTTITIQIYNSLGELVYKKTTKEKEAGIYYFNWNANTFASGTYFVKFITPKIVQTKKLMLVK